MSGPINTLPRGMLDLLGLQTGGINPRDLAEIVQPQLDMFRFYFAQEKEDFILSRAANIPAATPLIGFNFSWTSTGPADIIAGAGQLRAPQTELWLIEQYTAFVDVVAAAGDVCWLRLGMRDLGGNRFWLRQQNLGPTTGLAAVGTTWAAETIAPFVLLPGYELMVTAGGINLTNAAGLLGSLELIRLRV